MRPSHLACFRLLCASFVAVILAACGNRGTLDNSAVWLCKPGAATCLSEQVGQICNAQGQWATFQCPGTKPCQDGACQTSDERCSEAERECLTDSVGQICSRDRSWIAFACGADEVCRDGDCQSSCTPETHECLSTTLQRICRSDGSGWDTNECPSGVCRDGDCQSTCTPETHECLSTKLRRVCRSDGSGWDTNECPSGVCRDGDCQSVCTPKTHECLSTSLQRSCRSDGSGWDTNECPSGVCRDGDCQSSCTPQAHECVSTSVQRICRSDGSGWDSNQCPSGSTCKNGACIGSCKTGTGSCINQQLLRECRTDQTGFVERVCPASMNCSEGKCSPVYYSTCAFGDDTCLDEHTALVCLNDGSGFKTKDCPSETKCRAGQCLGPVCAAGLTLCVAADSTATDFVGVQTCNGDGTGYSVAVCDHAGECVWNQDTGKHECYTPPCTVDDEVCGDPVGGQSSTNQLSRCETLTNGKLGWVVYQCDAPATCESTSAASASCHAECSPGDTRCDSDGKAVQNCGTDGEWVSSPCDNTGDTKDMCVLVPSTKKPVCGDQDCRNLQWDIDGYQTRGRCLSDQIRRCGEDGRLGAAVECDEGKCVVESDGLGSCVDPTRCQHEDGWRECIASNDSYRTCLSGHWEFTLCPAKVQCTKLGDGLATCGNDCIEGMRRCVDADYQVCTSSGTWGASQHCTLGECNPKTTDCELACDPGKLRCSGDVVVASDGTSLGSRSVRTCTDKFSWGPPVACDSSGNDLTLCRRSGLDEHLGCVQCVGRGVNGANEEGAVDSRCSSDTKGHQDCQADNTWPKTVAACESTEHCAKQRDGSINATCSDYGCPTTSGRPRFCVGYETVTAPQTIDDCCSGECDSSTGQCVHRKRQYDPTCNETSSCWTGRYDTNGNSIYETCCSGFCLSGQGCLKIKAKACDTVTSCSITKVDHASVCCSSCLTTGLCSVGADGLHPIGEYFPCGTSSTMCWSVGSCAWKASGSASGAMFANCIQ
jgi:hypothetical protein